MRLLVILSLLISGCSMLHVEDDGRKTKIRLNSGYEPCKVKVKGGFNLDEVYYQCKWPVTI